MATALSQESGILELESKVLSFLYAHAASVKLLATSDDVARLLQVGSWWRMYTVGFFP